MSLVKAFAVLVVLSLACDREGGDDSDDLALDDASGSGTTGGSASDCEVLAQLDSNEPSGIAYCAGDEAWQRRYPVTCVGPGLPYPADDECESNCTGFGMTGTCIRQPGSTIPFCHYDCQSDADCGEGVCLCATDTLAPFNQCVGAYSCAEQGDCAGECGISLGLARQPTATVCREEADECAGNADCKPTEVCNYQESGFTCGFSDD